MSTNTPGRGSPPSPLASDDGADCARRWLKICRVDDIPMLGARVVHRRGAEDVAIFRTADDKVFALADRCPHKGGPLSQGIVYGERVACPLHNWSIELGSGCAVAPDDGCTTRYATRIDAGEVELDLEPEAARAGS